MSLVRKIYVAVCGAGPAGFYTTKYLLERDKTVKVDIIEKLPTPYGLVRYGVAPDHEDVKSVIYNKYYFIHRVSVFVLHTYILYTIE